MTNAKGEIWSNKFNIGDHVRHKESDFHVFEIVGIREAVPNTSAPLYECKQLKGKEVDEIHAYHENDLLLADSN